MNTTELPGGQINGSDTTQRRGSTFTRFGHDLRTATQIKGSEILCGHRFCGDFAHELGNSKSDSAICIGRDLQQRG